MEGYQTSMKNSRESRSKIYSTDVSDSSKTTTTLVERKSSIQTSLQFPRLSGIQINADSTIKCLPCQNYRVRFYRMARESDVE